MAVRLRLTRVGGKKDPIWRVVAADQRSPRDGRFIEVLGQYNAQTSPSTDFSTGSGPKPQAPRIAPAWARSAPSSNRGPSSRPGASPLT